MRVTNRRNFYPKANLVLHKKCHNKFIVIEKDDGGEIAEIMEIRRIAEIEGRYREDW